MLSLPDIGYMMDNFQPTLYTLTEVKKTAGFIRNFCLVSVEWNEGCCRKLKKIKEIYNLIEKYSNLNQWYENLREEEKERADFDSLASPQLLDALGIGMPLSNSSFSEYTPGLEEDIKRIIELMPRSLNCNLGQLKARLYVFPLAMACLNPKIPMPIIELLIKKGANLKATYHFIRTEQEVTILYDLLTLHNDQKRYNEVKALFDKYSKDG